MEQTDKLIQFVNTFKTLWTAFTCKLTDICRKLKLLAFRQLSLLMVLICLGIECFIFNVRFWTFSETEYPQVVVTLPQSTAGQQGMLLEPQKSELTIDNLNLKLRTVKVTTSSMHKQAVNVLVKICDESSYYQPQPANAFLLNPGGTYHSRLFYLDPRGKVNKLQLTFIPPFTEVRVTSVILNAPPEFNFSMLRCCLLSAFLIMLLTICRFRVYSLTVTYSESRLFKVLSRCVLALVLLLSLGYFALTSPTFTSPIAYNVLGENCVDLTTEKHELLKDLPKNLEELQRCDPYVQLISALRHGSLAMEFPWDFKINTLKNPNDPSERARAGVREYFDMQTHENRYYTPHGLTPLIIAYLPVLALTGKMPAPALANILCALPALIALYLALQAMLRTVVIRGNLLLSLGVQLALLCSCGVYMQQTAIAHYGLSAICGIAFLSFWLAGVYALPLCRNEKLLRYLLIAAGASVPFIVHSRPHLTFLAILLGAPYLIWFLYQRYIKSGRKAALTDLAAVSAPVAIGAILVMSWNYARYANPFDFGQFGNGFSLSDLSFHPELSMGHLLSLWWYYLFEPLNYVRQFPFVLPAEQHYTDQGRMVFLVLRISLFAIPLMWGMWLIFFRRPKQTLIPRLFNPESKDGSPLLQQSAAPALGFILTLIYLPYMCYFLLYGGGVVCSRYFLDLTVAPGLIASTLIVLNLYWERSAQSRILYILALFLLAKTVFIGLMLPFDFDEYHLLKIGNTDAFIFFTQLLQPFSY